MAKKDTLQKVDNNKLEKVTGGTYIPADSPKFNEQLSCSHKKCVWPTNHRTTDGDMIYVCYECHQLLSHGGSAYNYQKNKATKNGNLSLC